MGYTAPTVSSPLMERLKKRAMAESYALSRYGEHFEAIYPGHPEYPTSGFTGGPLQRWRGPDDPLETPLGRVVLARAGIMLPGGTVLMSDAWMPEDELRGTGSRVRGKKVDPGEEPLKN